MVYCTAKDILDAVMLESTDNSPEQRIKALAWLNQSIRDILNQPREWKFLTDVVTLPVANSAATLPTGAGDITYIVLGDKYYDKEDQLDDESALSGSGEGYTLDSDGVITFYPETTESQCSLKYETGLTTKYTDDISPTIFPIEFENLIISGTLMRLFKTEKDGRFTSETQLFQYQLGLMKAKDNRSKPNPQLSPNGYVRTQLTSTKVSS